MKKLAICLFFAVPCFAQGARQYYNELYKAGGLDRMADAYVCFDNDSNLETFFIFGESKTIREFMIADGTFSKLSKDFQKRLNDDFLVVRGYDKGVAIGGEDFYNRDGNSWVGEKFVLSKEPKKYGRMRFDITWETLRYKRSVEVLDAGGSFRGQYARYGRCEKVSPEITQHGNP